MPAVQKGRHRLPYTIKIGTLFTQKTRICILLNQRGSTFTPALAGGARVCVQKHSVVN